MPAALLDRTFLERLERLTVHWLRSFPGLVGGHNASRFAGAGQEFLDHRHFHHGDDLRAVNWRAYMRLEKLFLKMFQVEPRDPAIFGGARRRRAGHDPFNIVLDALSSLLVKPAEPEAADNTLEGLVREMLRPMMKEWLDANLPRLVEGMVAKEIARITGRPL